MKMITEKKTYLKLYLTQSDREKIEELGQVAGRMTAASFASVVLSEMARVPATSACVWQALARIAEEAEESPAQIAPQSLPPPRKKSLRRAESTALEAHA